ncbi:hypothetical protein ACNPEY_03565, partial [Klebsiella pneumoniae]
LELLAGNHQNVVLLTVANRD